jgi:hypothetical protein
VSTVLSEAVDKGEVMSDALGLENVEEETALALRFVDRRMGAGYGCICAVTGLQSLSLSSALTSIPVVVSSTPS